MIIEFFKKSKFLFILSLFIILISIINSLFYVSYNNYPQEINSTNFLLQNSESVHSSGTGPSIQVLEYANGSKNHYDLNNGTSISWDIPNNWIGDNFSVMVSNLTTSVKNDLYEVADDGNTNILNHISGNYADTRFDDNNNWSLRWGDIETTLITLDANLYFYTLAYQGTISNLHVHLKLTTTNCNKNNYLEIRLMDESSGYQVIDQITSSGTFIIDQDISSSPDSYVDPNNRLWINFYGSNQGPGSIKRVDIDYVYINITTSRMYIDPDIIHMNVNGTAITGTWDLAVAGLYGPWSSGTCWFTFDCDPGYSISFNAFSTMWINKTSHTGSTYYLGSGDHPSVNYWKITFNAIDASVDYQDQEFIILHPAKWVFNNATGPSGTVPVSPGSYKGNSTIPITQTYYESGLWEFFCSSQNIISNIYIRKNGHDVDTVNITDIVDISCTLIESNTQGSFNLSIYNESGIVHQELQTASGNTVIFTSWNLSQDIINNGVYTIEISWKNETDIGYIRDYITIIYPTELINYTIHHTYFIGNILEMTVFYNNTFAKNGFIENGIIGANLDYVIKNSSNPSIDSGILNDTNNGNYTNSINLSSYSIGNYTLIINASKKWYHNLSISFYIEIFGFNTSINISLPMSNGIGQAYCNYTETVVFKLWYFNVTQNNSSFINGANIEVYKSSIPVSTVFWEESVAESVYYIYLNSSNLDLVSTWDDINNNITITVQVSKHSFIPRTINIEWDVRNSTAILFGNSSETRLSGRFGIKLNYTNQQLNNPISDYFSPSFRLYYNGTLFSSLKSNYLSIGLWNLSCFFNETRNVTYNILVKVSTVGFKDTTWNFLLHVNVTATKNYTFGITENIFYYQDLNFSIIYNKTYPVLDGLDNAEIISTKFAITTTNMGSGLYFVNVHTANLLNVSHYKIYFLIRQTHFQEINFSISFNIINVTTKSVIFNTTDTSFDGNNTRAYVNQSIIYELIYNDTFKNSFIKDSTIIARIYNYNNDLISSQYTFQSYPAFYRIKVDIFGIHSGNYTLKIISRKQNYFESVITLNFTIMPSITQMVLLRNHPQYGIIQFTEYTEWDHYQIFFMSNFTGIFYNEFKQYKQPISWGYVRYIICEKDKTPNNQSNWLKNGTFVYSIQNELYCSPSISLKYSNGTFLPTGNYTVYVYTFARDCINRSMNFSLTIVPRLTGKIEVFTVSSITQGQSFQIQVKLTVNDNPYSAQLKMYIYCYDSDGNLILNKSYTMITGLNGIDIKLFQAPNDASKISIDVKFSGEFRPYPLVSIEPISLAQPITISVQKSVNFLPIILLIIAICAAFIGTIVYVRSKVIAPKKTKKLEISQEKYTHFKDLTSIMNIMLVYKPTNEITYNKILIDKGYDEEYWNNLKNKILEFKGSGNKKNAALDLIFYDSIKILIDDGQYIRLALLLENIPSEIILRSVVDFIQYFELNHYGYLKKNELNKINDLEEYLDKQLGIAFIMPYTISIARLTSIKYTPFQETVINMARMVSTDEGYFYISDLYKKISNESLVEGMTIFQTIEDLINKKVFVPFDVSIKKEKKAAKRIKEVPKFTTKMNEYQTNVVSLTNRALNAQRRGDLQEALEAYKEAARLAKEHNFIEEWRRYMFKVEEIKTQIERSKEAGFKPAEISEYQSTFSTKYSVKMTSFSRIKQKTDEKVLGDKIKKMKAEKIEAKKEAIESIPPQTIKETSSKPVEPSPAEIDEIRALLSVKSTKSKKYPEVSKEIITIDDEIQSIDEEIESIDKKIKTTRKKEAEHELTPLEKALKYGINLKDEEIFDIGSSTDHISSHSLLEEDKSEELEDEIIVDISQLDQFCPKCNAQISSKYLRLIVKGYSPECENCGYKLKLKDLLNE